MCRIVRSRRKWTAKLTFLRKTLAKPKILKFYLLSIADLHWGDPHDENTGCAGDQAKPSLKGRHQETNQWTRPPSPWMRISAAPPPHISREMLWRTWCPGSPGRLSNWLT